MRSDSAGRVPDRVIDLFRPARWARAFFHGASGAGRAARARLDGSRAAVLMYHRVLPRTRASQEYVEPGMYVAPETFARHLDWLEEFFRVLSLDELVTRLAEDRPLPPRACAITFDDGWRDNAEFAVPELARRDLPATIFVVTERVGTKGAFWPDELLRRVMPLPLPEQQDLALRLGVEAAGNPAGALLAHVKALSDADRRSALESLRGATASPPAQTAELLDWEEVDRVAGQGIDIEAHGATHAILSSLPAEEIERELQSALVTLRERGHGRRALLAYPNGSHDERVRRIARAVGYRAAVTTRNGLATAGTDPMAVPRLALHDDVSRSRAEFLFRVPGHE